MRPIRLEIQAFGPYAGNQVLNMEELGQTGIYAIIGETGSGKTTIFDAIVYALYGTGSGEDRDDGKSLRSVAAPKTLETKVELQFTCAGKAYTILRKPIQVLQGKRKKEDVEYKASVRLTMPDGKELADGKVIDGSSKEPGLIERDILGVTRDQFCQTVMIAQGEFRKLLRAKTDERTEILRRIFKTQPFDDLSRHMDMLCKRKNDELMESRRQVSNCLKAMWAAEGSPLQKRLKELQGVPFQNLLLQDAEDLAAEIAGADQTELDELLKSREQAEGARDRAKQAYQQALELQEKRKTRSALADLQVKQRAELEQARRQQTDAEARRPEIAELDERIAAWGLKLNKYDELAVLEADRDRTGKDLEQAKKDLSAAMETEGQIRKQQAELTEEAASLSGAADRKLAATNALRDARDKGKQLDTLNKRCTGYRDAQRILEEKKTARDEAVRLSAAASEALYALTKEQEELGNTAQVLTGLAAAEKEQKNAARTVDGLRKLLRDLEKARSEWEKAQKAYSTLEQAWKQADGKARHLRGLYNASIAGLWARDLQEGLPCPVCGSTHHPLPAALSEESATEEEVKGAEALAEEARAAWNAQASTCSARQAEMDGLRRQMAEQLEEIPEEKWKAEIDARAENNRASLEELKKKIAEARKADDRSKALTDAVPRARQEAEAAGAAMKEADTALATAGESLKAAMRERENAARGIMPEGWTDLDLSDAIAGCEALQKEKENEVERARKEEERLTEIDGLQKKLAESLQQTAESIRTIGNTSSALKARLEGQQQSWEKLRQELPWETKALCEAAIEKEKQKRTGLQEAIRAAGDNVNRLNQESAKTEGQIKVLDEDLSGKPEVDPEGLKTEYEARLAEYQAVNDRSGAVQGRQANNARHGQTLTGQADAVRGLEREHRIMQDVADTANGRVKGSDKLTLETYVQTGYFDRIIAYANKRLIHMSRRQYDLARQDVGSGSRQSKTGLDLDVVDHANGQRRAVGTLSGGEGFLAALSFALGMSDAIQANAASAVQLDTMFVDEGFGSLSESYLGLVMDELNDTAEAGHRLIGIISHVDEVKEGISRRIEVTKSSAGVSTAKIV